MKLQSSFEFISTYSWVFIVFFIIALVVSVYYFIQSSSTSYSYCDINQQLQCTNVSVIVNSSGSFFLIKIKNDIGTTIGFKNKSIFLFPSYNNVSYTGSCIPAYVSAKNYFVCGVFISKYSPTVGSQINARFNIIYGICKNCDSSSLTSYSVSGTITEIIQQNNSSNI